MWECNMLSRYNTTTDSWREKAAQDKEESESGTNPDSIAMGAVDCGSMELGNDITRQRKESEGDKDPESDATGAVDCGSQELGSLCL